MGLSARRGVDGSAALLTCLVVETPGEPVDGLAVLGGALAGRARGRGGPSRGAQHRWDRANVSCTPSCGRRAGRCGSSPDGGQAVTDQGPGDQERYDRLVDTVREIAAEYFTSVLAGDPGAERSTFDFHVVAKTRESQSKLIESFAELAAFDSDYRRLGQALDSARLALDLAAMAWAKESVVEKFFLAGNRRRARYLAREIVDLERQVVDAGTALDQQRQRFVELVVATVLVESARESTSEEWGTPANDEVSFRDGASLSSKANDKEFLYTAGRRDVELALTRRGGSSIGLAGSRGAGKTELARHFAVNRPGQVGVMTWAPASGDSEMFMRWLLRRLCEQVIAVRPGGADAVRNRSATLVRRRFTDAMGANWLLIVALVTLVAGLVLVLDDWVTASRKFVGFCLLGVAGVLLVDMLFRAWPTATGVRVGVLPFRSPKLLASRFGRTVASPEPPIRHHLADLKRRTSDWASTFALRTPVDGDEALAASASGDESPEVAEAWRAGPEAIATDLLTRLDYTESIETGAEVSASVSALGGKLTTSRGLQAQRLTTLDLIEETAGLVSAVAASGRRVVIAVDELDKLSSDDDALEFLNEIKVLFPISGCSFLVSVSDHAWVNYARRGMPLRDAFDSSFDEVVRVEPLDLKQVRELLARRVGSVTLLQAGLIYSLSGGLPRDVLRSARRLARSADATQLASGRRPLVEASSLLLSGELVEKAVSAEMRLSEFSSERDVRAQLDCVRALRTSWGDDAALLCAVTTCLLVSAQPGADEDDASDGGALVSIKVNSVVRETGVYALLLHTLREMLARSTGPSDVVSPSAPENDSTDGFTQPLLLLAEARRELTSDPRHSAVLINRSRASSGLAPLDLYPTDGEGRNVPIGNPDAASGSQGAARRLSRYLRSARASASALRRWPASQ